MKKTCFVLFLVFFSNSLFAQLQQPRKWVFEIYDKCAEEWIGDANQITAWSLQFDGCYYKFAYMHARTVDGDRIYEGDILLDLNSDRMFVANIGEFEGVLRSNLSPNGQYQRISHIVNGVPFIFGGNLPRQFEDFRDLPF